MRPSPIWPQRADPSHIRRDDLETWLWGVLRARTPWQIHMTDVAMRALAVQDDGDFVRDIVRAGLERRIWNGRRQDAGAFTLAGGKARVFELLREYGPIAGPYVCVGDLRRTSTGRWVGGPGCGLVFSAARESKCCPLCHSSRIAFSHRPGDHVTWLDPFDPGCRKLRLFRVCENGRDHAFEATRTDAKYCSNRCKNAAHRTRQQAA